MNTQYWNRMDELLAAHRVVIDRPQGTAHPRYPEFIYPYDYGYLEGTLAMDQGGIDVWVGSLPEYRATGIVCTVDMVKKDAEIKILIGCTREEAAQILNVHNDGPQSAILVWRE